MPFSIRTNDVPPVQIDNFDKIQAVVKKIQKTQVMKNIAAKLDNEVKWGNRSINIHNQGNLAALGEDDILSLVDVMSLEYHKMEAYSNNDSVFQKEFASHLSLLLGWLNSIQERVGEVTLLGVSKPVLKKALQWLVSAMDRVNACADDDFACIDDAVSALKG